MFLTKVFRIVFAAVFVIFTLNGIFGGEYRKSVISARHGIPVISTTVDATETAGTYSEDTVFTIGENLIFPENSAEACAVISADTGDALYLKNSDRILPMASTTKIMTALVVLEVAHPDMTVDISAEMCGAEGSSVYLVQGEKLTVRDLLYGLLLESGNDAAEALAIKLCGSIEKFADLMNKKASDMGLIYTHFENPHGLSAENHRTTAHELALITYHAMKNPIFREIVGTKNYIVKSPDGVPLKYFSNHNRLLSSYDGTTGVKTGYTLNSGRCLVSSAKKNGSEFIVVTLNDRNDFADHKKMLDFAFDNFGILNFAGKGEISFLSDYGVLSNTNDICVLYEKKSGNTHFDAEAVLK